jgi:uracil-DNA glycosylase
MVDGLVKIAGPMTVLLRDAMREVLEGWREDLDPRWRGIASDAELGFDRMDQALALEPWEPIFPARKGKHYPGAPSGAHIFHAFDRLEPDRVRVVVLGQDPYPCGAFSTGRAFEAGNVASWRELEKMFSVSVRTFMLMIAAARTGDESYARSVAEWPRLRSEIETGDFAMDAPGKIADRWVGQGALLLNSALTLSRFSVEGDPHQVRGHFPLWRPFIETVLRRLAARDRPTGFIGFGDQAANALAAAGIESTEGAAPTTPVACFLRKHPARGSEVLSTPNPFVLANRHIEAMGEHPVLW